MLAQDLTGRLAGERLRLESPLRVWVLRAGALASGALLAQAGSRLVRTLIAVFMAVLIGGTVAADGRSNWYKGVQLVAFYLILAAMFYLVPAETAPTLARFR